MIVLTGASGGIGKEMLTSLSKLDDVVAIYNNNIPEIIETSHKILPYKLDVSNERNVTGFVEDNLDILKNIILIHGAGVAKSNLTINHSKEMWDAAIDVNLTANFLLTKALLPLMIKQRWGRIVHFSSIRASAGTLSYTTTKQGLVGMSKVLAKEYAKFNITSNALILGAFDTGMFQSLKEKIKNELINQIPAKKLGKVQDIVRAIDFIIDSPFVNGAEITIDGGASG
jgi:3-oxoacyl-[acyl-carrier protein] reductase